MPSPNPKRELVAGPSFNRTVAPPSLRLNSESGLSPHRQPFLYALAALVAGIVADRLNPLSITLLAPLACLSLIFSIRFMSNRNNIAATVSLLAGLIVAGAMLSSAERGSVDDSRLTKLAAARAITTGDPVELTGVLAAPPEPAQGMYYLDVEAESVRVRAKVIAATGHARLTLPLVDDEAAKEFANLALDYGSRVSVLVRLERARTYKNPGSPEFDEFLERSGFDLKGVIKSPLLIERPGGGRSNAFLALLYRARSRVMGAIDKRFKSPVSGTLKAMLVNNRYFLDRETSSRLRESATFHVLAISGMHISLIAWVLLGGGSAIKRRRIAQAIFSLVGLWTYTVMVGLAPPVVRATVMITAGLIAPMLFRRAASINTVALAAFLMLSLKPALVADPGFQLSFIAVAGIVVVAMPIASKLRAIGDWRPTPQTPHPPSCPRPIRLFAEALFWDERSFRKDMRRSPVRYRLDKARAAHVLGRFRIQSLVRGVMLLAITSLAAQLSTFPLMACYFNRAAPVGILLNIAAGLLTGLLIFAATLAMTLNVISAWAAAHLEWIVNSAHYLLVNSVVPFAGVPGSTFRVAHYEGWPSIIYALYFVPLSMLAALIDRWRPVDEANQQMKMSAPRKPAEKVPALSFLLSKSRIWPTSAGLLSCVIALLLSLVAVACPPYIPPGNLTIHFLDVNQGDCALVIFPHGKALLVDGGGEIRFGNQAAQERVAAQSDSSESDMRQQSSQGGEEIEADSVGNSLTIGEVVVSRFLWSLGLTRVDYVLATHADADHIDGLSDVLENFSVGEALVGVVPINDAEFSRFAETAMRRGVPVGVVGAGGKFEVDGVTVEVLWPPLTDQPSTKSGNDESVVLRLGYGSVRVLLAGDIEQKAEDALLKSGVDLRAEVLKVPHHGSKTSSSEEFLDATQPQVAVISVGERSRFGHPHPVVINRYLARGTKLFHTGRDGMITLTTDGTALNITTCEAKGGEQ